MYAINIALTLEKNLKTIVTELNAQLTGEHTQAINFVLAEHIPHLTLAMGVVDDQGLQLVQQAVAEDLTATLPLEIRAQGLETVAITPHHKLTYLEFDSNQYLQQLHINALEVLDDAAASRIPATTEMFASPEQVNDLTLDWVNNYRQNSTGPNFSPTITIGLGEISESSLLTKAWPKPYLFFTVAVLQLGNYCTCQKQLI